MVKKLKRFELRLTDKDFTAMKLRAHVYTNGDLTKWLTYAALNCAGKFLVKSDLAMHIEEALSQKKTRLKKNRVPRINSKS